MTERKQITGCSFPITMINHAIVILETVKDDMGNYIPCIVKKGETGYYTTDWKWGTDLKEADDAIVGKYKISVYRKIIPYKYIATKI